MVTIFCYLLLARTKLFVICQILSMTIITVVLVVIVGYTICTLILIGMKSVDATFAKSKYVLLSELGSKFNLSFSSHLVLNNKLIALDGLKKKIKAKK